MKARLDKAIELFYQQKVQLFICSGGQKPGKPHEAEVMRNYLINQHVPEKAILMDKTGVNTRATAINTTHILKKLPYHSVVIVTHDYPLCVQGLAFRQQGIIVDTAHAMWDWDLRDLYSIGREFSAYYYYWLVGE